MFWHLSSDFVLDPVPYVSCSTLPPLCCDAGRAHHRFLSQSSSSLAAKAVELRKKNGEDVDLVDKEGVYDEWKGVKVGKQVLMSVQSSLFLPPHLTPRATADSALSPSPPDLAASSG